MQKLSKVFYERADVATVAKDLLGKIIITKFNNQYTSARIVETEAYAGMIDKASHAYNNKRTNRTEVMFGKSGKAYVYLCYGIHHMFNIVTNEEGKPDAVLIRGAEPLEGIDMMLNRMNKKIVDRTIGRGPGNVAKALGIFTTHTGMSLQSKYLFLAEDGTSDFEKMMSRRIGVDYAADHAKWLYRFYIKDNKHVTKHRVNKEGIVLL